MAHTLDTFLRITGSSSPVTASYTCGAGATVLVLAIITGGSTARAGGAPTYNGIAMTEVYSGIKAASSPETVVDMYYLLNPPTGSAYQISIPNTGSKSLYCMASSYNAASGYASDFDVKNYATNTSTNPTCSITTNYADLLVACIGDGANTWAPTGQTGTRIGSFDYDDGAYGDSHQYYQQTAAGTTSMSWTFGTSEDWAIIVVGFKEVVAGNIVSLAGVINGVASVSGFNAITKTIKVTSQGTAGVTGFVKILKTIAGAITGTSVVSGFTGITKKLVGSVSGISSVVSNLSVIIVKYLQGVVQGLSSVSGIAKIYRGFNTSVSGVSTVSAFAKVLKTFQASVAGTSNVSGIAKIFRGLKAVVNGVAQVSGILTVLAQAVYLSAIVAGHSIVSGFVSVTKTLKTVSNGVAQVSGMIGRLYRLSGQAGGTATVNITASIIRGLKVVSSGISQTAGNLTVIIQEIKEVLLSAVVSGTSAVNGLVSVFKIALAEKIKVILQVSGREGKLVGSETITQKEPSKLELMGGNKTIRLKREVN